MTSVEEWRRETIRSTERSHKRRHEDSPHPFPVSAREWLIALTIAGAIMLVGWLFLLLFGAGAWS